MILIKSHDHYRRLDSKSVCRSMIMSSMNVQYKNGQQSMTDIGGVIMIQSKDKPITELENVEIGKIRSTSGEKGMWEVMVKTWDDETEHIKSMGPLGLDLQRITQPKLINSVCEIATCEYLDDFEWECCQQYGYFRDKHSKEFFDFNIFASSLELLTIIRLKDTFIGEYAPKTPQKLYEFIISKLEGSKDAIAAFYENPHINKFKIANFIAFINVWLKLLLKLFETSNSTSPDIHTTPPTPGTLQPEILQVHVLHTHIQVLEGIVSSFESSLSLAPHKQLLDQLSSIISLSICQQPSAMTPDSLACVIRYVVCRANGLNVANDLNVANGPYPWRSRRVAVDGLVARLLQMVKSVRNDAVMYDGHRRGLCAMWPSRQVFRSGFVRKIHIPVFYGNASVIYLPGQLPIKIMDVCSFRVLDYGHNGSDMLIRWVNQKHAFDNDCTTYWAFWDCTKTKGKFEYNELIKRQYKGFYFFKNNMIEAVGRISAGNFILIAPESQQFKYEIASKHVAYRLSYSTGKATQLTLQSNLHSEPVDSFSNTLTISSKATGA